jgi:hypothetical protein
LPLSKQTLFDLTYSYKVIWIKLANQDLLQEVKEWSDCAEGWIGWTDYCNWALRLSVSCLVAKTKKNHRKWACSHLPEREGRQIHQQGTFLQVCRWNTGWWSYPVLCRSPKVHSRSWFEQNVLQKFFKIFFKNQSVRNKNSQQRVQW